METWKDIKTWPGYAVSDEGEVVRKSDGLILKQYIQKSGYVVVWMNRGYGSAPVPVHRIVAETFHANPEGKPFVDHINTVRHDNRACNLRWVTPAENNRNPLTCIKRRKHG